MFLLIIDAHSKWIDVYEAKNPTSSATIDKLRQTFSIHSLPEMIVSDNGSVFTSEEFKHLMTQNGIQHVNIAPYHPSSNGLAKTAVQTFKVGMKKLSGGTIQS
uniref:Integrase catalytic domain-containing protein n=1 Tax=Latimeria chalumnae TaxID=7897 RepID=H3AA96_LATCH